MDEFNNILNTNDDFRDRLDQRAWRTEQEEQGDAADRSRIKGKWTSETENILFTVDDSDLPTDGQSVRREKVGSVLQSFFYYRLGHLDAKERDAKNLEPDSEDWKWLNHADRQVTSVFLARYKESRFNFQVQVSSKLRQFQDAILANPDGLGLLSVAEAPQTGQVFSKQHLTALPSHLHNLPEARLFLETRRTFFQSIRDSAKGGDGIWETFDLVRNITAVEAYVGAYNQLLATIEHRMSEWDQIADSEKADLQAVFVAVQELDLVSLQGRLPDSQERYTTLLVPPIHPLRLGWFVALLNLFTDWETLTRADFERQLPYWTDEISELFFGKLTPTNHPLLIVDEAGQAFEYAGELAFGWGLFAHTAVSQNGTLQGGSLHRSLIQYLQQTLDIADQTGWVENDVDETVVYRHIRNYLALHPYTEQITINLFNAGEGQVFRDVLLELQEEAELQAVRYEVRLFFNEHSFVADGEAINRLINPATTLTGTADAFSQPGRNRLFPKLRLSLNRIGEYIANPGSFDCHISFLINPFPLRPRIQLPDAQAPSFYLEGLVVQPVIKFDHDTAGTTSVWTRYVSPLGTGLSFPISRTISTAFGRLSHLTSASLAGKPTAALPATELIVGSAETMLLDKIHSYSDWVVTFDRHLGPEIFDLPIGEGEEPFLLDYIPGENFLGINTFLTSKPGAEVQQLIAPIVQTIFSPLSVSSSTESTTQILNDLRTLSGSLVMQLSRQPSVNKVLEYTGLALAKRLLERKGLLDQQFVIPLDLHQNLLRPEKETDSQSRADLLLVAVDAARRCLSIQVLEVKMRTAALGSAGREDLFESVDGQLTNTVRLLRQRFTDEEVLGQPRFDRHLRTKELSDLLLFYANRAERYGLLGNDEASEIRSFLSTLDAPCNMEFAKRGIIFDLDSQADILKESRADVTFYRVGQQGLTMLLDEDTDLRTQRPGSIWDSFERDLTPEPVTKLFHSIDLPGDKTSEPTKLLPGAVPLPIEEGSDGQDSKTADETISENTPSEADSPNYPLGYELPDFDLYIGGSEPSNQFGVLGKTQTGQVIALDLNGTHTISLFGVQGAGKSYSIGTITEMVLTPISRINSLPNPLAGVIFHYSQDQNYKPEFASMAYPNDVKRESDELWQGYGANPQGIDEVVLLVPKAKLEERKADYPNLKVGPLALSSAELNIQDWRFLMGAIGNQSLYIKHLNSIMKSLRDRLTLDGLKIGIQQSALLTASQRELALSRLSLADEYIDDSVKLGDLMQPGRLLLVDLRDEFLDQDDALGLFVIMLNIFSNVKRPDGSTFNKFIVFDEAHKYMSNGDLTESIVETIRLMRHKGVSVLIASQDPPSLPNAIIELSSAVVVHRFNSPQWLKHIQRSITQFEKLTPTDLSYLGPGEAYLWATKANKKHVTQQPVKITTRPRVTKHGGGTRQADA